MDRDKRWDRVKLAYDQLVNGEGRKSDNMVQAMQESYDEGVTDEFVKPVVNSTVDGRIKEGDVVIFFNYRNDRAKELTQVLTQQDMPEQGMHTIKDLQFFCMTPYDSSFTGVGILFPKENVQNTLAEYISSKGLKQLHIAETEKYAHVTFFFNGGREAPFEGEDRILVPSPKVATYDLKPEMSAYEVKDKLVAAIGEKKYDWIVVNYANGDMVGHTGVYEAIEKAVENAKIGEIPAVMIDEDVHRQMEQYLGGMQQQGISADMYYKLTGTTEEDLHKQFEEGAAKRVKTNLVLEAIVAAEGVTATEEEIDKEIKELAAQYGMDEKAVRSALSDDMLNHDISIRKVVDEITDSAKQVEKD